jgi:hypothetical protein
MTLLTRTCLAFALPTRLLPALRLATSFTGQVVSVSDGATIQVLRDRRAEKVRLNGCDSQELNQPYGQAAKRFVLQVAAQQTVTVKVITTDRYCRTVGDVILPEDNSPGVLFRHRLQPRPQPQLLTLRPSDCCPSPKSASSLHGQEPRRSRQIGHQSAFDPGCRSCHRRPVRRPYFQDAECGRFHRLRRRKNTFYPVRHIPSCRSRLPDVGIVLDWLNCL